MLVSHLEARNIEKSYFGETRRICAPKETFEKMKGLFPVFGITRVANVTGLDTVGIPVYTASRPNARSLSVSQGKGYTHDAAKVSAIMESIESYHAESIHLPLKLCTYSELYYSQSCVDVARIAKPKDSLFSAGHRLLWVEGIDLMSHTSKWLPFESVHIDYRTPLPTGHGCFISSSNGLSSGNHPLEAIIHGLCEVIERDALTLWSIQQEEKRIKTKIAPETINDPFVRDILGRFEAAGIDVGIWEITSNLGIPAFLCRILPKLEPDISGQRPASGMGCHLSKDIALLRAVTEAAQSRLTFISGARDDMSRESYTKFLSAEEYLKWHHTISEHAPRNYQDIKSVETATLDGDLAILLGNLRAEGISEVITVDLTKEEFMVPVVKVVVPGLESFLSSDSTMLGERAGRVLQTGGGS